MDVLADLVRELVRVLHRPLNTSPLKLARTMQTSQPAPAGLALDFDRLRVSTQRERAALVRRLREFLEG